MRLFDLHCDTLTACLRAGESLASNTLHVDLERGLRYDRWAQAFAIFLPDSLRGEDAWLYYKESLELYRTQLTGNRDGFTPILTVENGSVLGGAPERVAALAADGVRMLTLTWNGENELGCGVACDPSAGLTHAGRKAVLACWQHGILPDVSHLNEAGFWEVDALRRTQGKTARYIASHACCAAMHPHRRNLSDAQLRALFAADGLVGLCLYPEFLGGEGTAANVLQHLDHLLALGGEKHIALGSDFDGCTLHPDLAGVEKVEALRGALAKGGVPAETLEGFFWENAAAKLSLD